MNRALKFVETNGSFAVWNIDLTLPRIDSLAKPPRGLADRRDINFYYHFASRAAPRDSITPYPAAPENILAEFSEPA